MAKFIKNVAGVFTEEATVSTTAGVGDAGKVVHLDASGVLAPALLNATIVSAASKIVQLDGSGKLDVSVMPVGIAADTAIIQASENLGNGDYVNIHNVGGPRVRKADASAAGKEAHGFVTAAVLSGANATVFFEGTNNAVAGKTPGATQFLSATTAGATTETAPSGAGQIVQRIGIAVSATAVNTEVAQPITLA